MAESEASPILYEDLAQIEEEFNEIEQDIIRKQYLLSASLYSKRQALVSKIPNFWPLVFEAAPPEIDHYIQPTDSEIFAACLTGVDVRRFEIPVGPEKITASDGDPRSFSIRLDFDENEWFSDTSLEKKFWYRRSKNGWSGLVSEPVKIHWKKGKDTTHGLSDAAIKLWEARSKAGDMAKTGLPEYETLLELLENWNGENTSFFTWFSFVRSGGSYITAEESAQAMKEENERKEKRKGGTHVEAPDLDEDDIADIEGSVEVHEAGDDLANLIADDLWPGAIRYFTEGQGAEDLSDFDLEDEDDVEDDSEDEPIDIRSLVQDKSKNRAAEPPKKKQKK